MRKITLHIFLLLVSLCQLETFAQNVPITGRVIGADNNPVVGASVTIQGTTQGTLTDENGNFSISAPSSASLLIQSIGFSDQVVKITGQSALNISLAAGQSAGLDEVVVTGYTSQRKKDIIGSVAVVDVKNLKAIPSGSAMSALQGQASGVNVINSGSPGAESSIFIRGLTGFANAPLVLIDGVQANINDVPASDVESIQVLKDAGAAAIYGARGANGVIVITTKKGKNGAVTVNYESFYNYQIPRSLDKIGFLNTQQYAQIWSELRPTTALFPGGNVPQFGYRGPSGRGSGNSGDAAVDPALYKFDIRNISGNYIIAPFTSENHFYDDIMSPALMMNQNVTASGGTDKSNYLVSFGYLDHQGTLKNTSLKRYTMRVNSQYKIRDHIRIGENLNIFYKNNPNVTPVTGGFGPIQDAIENPPFIATYDIQGRYAGTFTGPQDELGDWNNPVATVNNSTNNRLREYGIQGNVYLEVDFLKNFTVRTSLGGTIDNYYSQKYNARDYWSRNGTGLDNLTESSGDASTMQWTNTLSYQKAFGNHNLSVLVGTEAIEQNARNLTGVGENYFLGTYEYLILGTATTRQFPTSSTISTTLASFFGKADYAFNDKYLVGITARRDGYSEFGPEKKYGNFYSVGLGWRLSQESFMKNVSWINDLKIRGSYGELGSKEGVPIGNAYSTFAQNPFFSYYDITGSGNTLSTGFFARKYGNPFTSWETNKMTNIGFDGTFFNNKLDLSVDYYRKSTDGLLRQLQLPATAGEGQSPVVNIGDIRNTGIDLSATYRMTVSNKVNLSVGANFTTYNNRIVSIPDPGYFDEGPKRFEEDHPMGSFFGYKVLGVFRDQKDVDDHAVQQSAEPGRWKYLDADGDGTIGPNDRVHYGDPNPDFTLGLNLNATVSNFDFGAQIYTAQGQDVYNDLLSNIGSWEKGVSSKSKIVLNAWSETNTGGTWKKNELINNFSNSGDRNSAFLEDGSYVRLRNVQIGYTFKASTLKNIGLNRIRVYIGGTNLVTLTDYTGLDPEIPQGFGGAQINGVDAGSYATEAGVVLGLNISF